MKEYFFFNGTDKEGPFSLEELTSQPIFEDTLIWYEGLEDWTNAGKLPILESIIKKSPPPIPPEEYQEDVIPEEGYRSKYDYSKVEDIAGVEYSKATVFTGAYIGLNLFIKPYFNVLIEIVISTVLVVIAWSYFKKYFDSQKDEDTGNWIAVIMGSYVVYGLLTLFVLGASWGENIGMAIWEWFSGGGTGYRDSLSGTLDIILIGLFGCMIAVFIAGFKVIQVNNNYPFPLKRIAISSMILIPVSMMYHLFDRVAISFIGSFYESQIGIVGNLILLLPYLLLLHHFYRADQDDQTA